MTDPTDRTLADDDLVSAYLDAEVDETERARVEQDPALRARAAELAAGRDALATRPEPPPGAADLSVLGALAVFDDLAGEQAAGEPSSVAGDLAGDAPTAAVVDLAQRRHRRRGLIIGAAAAAAAIVVAIPVISRLGGGSSTEQFAAVGTAINDDASVSESVGGGADASADAQRSAGQPPTTTAPGADAGAINDGAQTDAEAAEAPTPTTTAPRTATGSGTATAAYTGDLGDLDSPEDVSSAVTTPASTTTSAAGSPSLLTVEPPDAAVDVDSCAGTVSASDSSLGTLVRSAAATYQGTDVWVLLYGGTADAPAQVVVASRATCTVLLQRPIS